MPQQIAVYLSLCKRKLDETNLTTQFKRTKKELIIGRQDSSREEYKSAPPSYEALRIQSDW